MIQMKRCVILSARRIDKREKVRRMRFKGKPGMHVIDRETGARIGVFDTKGYIDVADERYAARMCRRFETVKDKPAEKPVGAAKRSVRKT